MYFFKLFLTLKKSGDNYYVSLDYKLVLLYVYKFLCIYFYAVYILILLVLQSNLYEKVTLRTTVCQATPEFLYFFLIFPDFELFLNFS